MNRVIWKNKLPGPVFICESDELDHRPKYHVVCINQDDERVRDRQIRDQSDNLFSDLDSAISYANDMAVDYEDADEVLRFMVVPEDPYGIEKHERFVDNDIYCVSNKPQERFQSMQRRMNEIVPDCNAYVEDGEVVEVTPVHGSSDFEYEAESAKSTVCEDGKENHFGLRKNDQTMAAEMHGVEILIDALNKMGGHEIAEFLDILVRESGMSVGDWETVAQVVRLRLGNGASSELVNKLIAIKQNTVGEYDAQADLHDNGWRSKAKNITSGIHGKVDGRDKFIPYDRRKWSSLNPNRIDVTKPRFKHETPFSHRQLPD